MPYALKKSKNGYFVVNATTGAHYSKKAQTKAKAESQLRILNQALYGEGIFDSLKNVGKRVANVFTNSYSPNTEAAVKKYGHYKVAAFEILRKPIESVFKGLLSVISAGKFTDYKYKYDDVFHLALILKLTHENDTVYLLTEKRPNIVFKEVKGFEDHKLPLEDVMLDSDFTHITFSELIMRTMAIMGPKFHTYDPVSNNCQIFIVALVNQLGVFKHNDFILQNARDFVSGHTAGIATFITSLGHAVGRLTGNAKAQRIGLAFRGGNELPPFAPFVNSVGIKEIEYENLAKWQQYLAELPPDQVVQDLNTLGVAGKVGDAALTAAELIPEVGEFIAIAHQVANALIGVFYTPKATIANRLQDAGIDIFCDDCQITNPAYPDTDPNHYVLMLPGTRIIVNAADQARYIALIYYQKVLGFNPLVWISKISAAEKNYLFPPGDATWPSKFGGLAALHQHANPYLVTAKFPK